MYKIKFLVFSIVFIFFNCCFAMTDIQKQDLANAAALAAKNSYSPYSKFPVGAAILTEKNETITGTNVENASFGLTNCAERSAVFNAVSKGSKSMQAIAISLKEGGSPCGACRQVLNEFNPKLKIIVADLNGKIYNETTLDKLLPDAFGPENL
jgi:cytidine deaminase